MDPNDSSPIVKKSYFSSFIELFGYGLSAVFGRIARSFFGIFNFKFIPDAEKDEPDDIR